MLPTIFPKISSVCDPIAAIILVASSGVDVPYATTVNPITILLTCSFFASATLPYTRAYPPKHKMTNPPIIIPISMATIMIFWKYLV